MSDRVLFEVASRVVRSTLSMGADLATRWSCLRYFLGDMFVEEMIIIIKLSIVIELSRARVNFADHDGMSMDWESLLVEPETVFLFDQWRTL